MASSPPISRFTPALLILERSPRLEPDLKHLLASPELLVRPCRSPRDVLELSSKMRGSVVVMDFDAGPAGTLRLLGQLSGGRHDARLIVLASPEWGELEWAVRDAGAIHFLPKSTPIRCVASHCQSLLDVIAGNDDSR
ncbi:MAG: hypothetical protein NT069_02340 [Planctomycetota bacterium]|nr:hypothetical protein [Planctomycetota bacterium]